MKKVDVEIVPNQSAPQSGDAIVKLNGQWLYPPNTTLQIGPADETQPGPEDGWPEPDLVAKSTRVGKQGVELLIGSEIVQTPALKPGTAVVVSIPSLNIRSELVWPELPVAAANDEAEPETMAEASVSEQDDETSGASETPELTETSSAQATAEQVQDEAADPATETNEAMNEVALAKALADGEAHLPADKVRPSGDDVTRSSALVATSNANGSKQSEQAPPEERRKPQGPRPLTPEEVALLKLRPKKPRYGDDIDAEVDDLMPARRELPLPASAVELETRRGNWFTRGLLPFALGVTMTSAVAAALLAFANPEIRNLVLPPPEPPATEAAALQMTTDLEKLDGILSIDSSGQSAEQARERVDLAEALRRADAALFPETGQANREEARYWLRKALALGMGDRGVTWALTQLGTIYAAEGSGRTGANPSQLPDFASARLLWQLAAARGSTEALCFLARLDAQGLGGPRDADRALLLLKRARRRGGCRDLDAMLARLGRKAS